MMGALLLFAATAKNAYGGCTGHGFFGFPTWYQYLKGQDVKDTFNSHGATHCVPALTGISDIWLIVAAVIEILLRIAALAAVAFVIYGAIQYVTSQGSPEGTTQARNTIINALLGLALAVMAAVIINFIAVKIP